jgi:hypothetical protein
MTDIIEVAKKCGATGKFLGGEPAHETNRTWVFLKPELQAFADHYRKEGAEEANKDSERLAWLIEHGARVAWTREGEHCRVFKNDGEDDYPVCGWPTFFETGIEAIDAAMAAELRAKGDVR